MFLFSLYYIQEIVLDLGGTLLPLSIEEVPPHSPNKEV